MDRREKHRSIYRSWMTSSPAPLLSQRFEQQFASTTFGEPGKSGVCPFAAVCSTKTAMANWEIYDRLANRNGHLNVDLATDNGLTTDAPARQIDKSIVLSRMLYRIILLNSDVVDLPLDVAQNHCLAGTIAEQVGVGFTCLSRVENGRLNYGDYPSNALIQRLAHALDADEDEFLVLAKRVSDRIRLRSLERPDVFGRLANLDDKSLDHVIATLDAKNQKRSRPRPSTQISPSSHQVRAPLPGCHSPRSVGFRYTSRYPHIEIR